MILIPFGVQIPISIHAPARGATQGFNLIGPGNYISIHAPARGATVEWLDEWVDKGDFNPRTREGCDKPRRVSVLGGENFNPRTREGCDLGERLEQSFKRRISIHAPARGATKDTTQV